MSTRNAFYEELLKGYGINTSSISKVEIKKGSKLVVYTGDKEIKINDPYLVKLAKLATLNIPLDFEFSKEKLLKRLYGLLTVFKGMAIPFSDFVQKNRRLSSKEIAKELENLEEIYSVDEQPKIYKDYLKIRICKKLTEMQGISFKDFEEDNEDATTESLLNVLASLYF